MSNKSSSLSGDIRQFDIFQAKDGGKSIDASGGVVDIKYYEDILSNSVSLSAVIVETGESDDKKLGNVGILDGLPIRGGEPSHIVIADHDKNVLKFKDDNKLYVNRVRNVIAGTQKDAYSIDFTSREMLANEQCRVCKRYDGKISENIKKILTEATSADVGIKTKKEVTVDETAINYNFIGNDRKPFYVCTWLASKSIPAQAGSVGGSAGYVFYETYDGYNFRSLDALAEQESKGNYLFSNTDDIPPEYTGKIISYDINKDIDLQNNLTIGAYANRTLFFDFYAYNYKVRNYSVDESGGSENNKGAGSKGKIVTLGSDEIDSVADEFRLPVSRLMNKVLDVGTLPSGKDIDAQLKTWKESPFDPTYDSTKTMVQSVMRYNQMFSIKINIMIAGDFRLRAGDLIRCEFPRLSTEPNTRPNKVSGGLYMIASLCHNITPRETYTSLTLVRDTFGSKPF
tara:strand:+ start:1053 stop:2420 length:1368 start_codon:yes stop_codon:yes gene_type:complete